MSKHKGGLMFLLLLIGCGTLSSSIKKEYIFQNNIGAEYIKLELWHDAKLHLLKALELAPKMASVYNNLGIVYEYFNQKDEAKEAYQKAVKLEPQTSVYQKNLILFEKELIGTTTTIKQDLEKAPSNIKISTKKITIKRMLEPKIKINKINRVALFAFSKDKEDKNAIEISKRISELFKISIVEESPFYILEDYEVRDLTQDEIVTQEDLEKSSKMIALNKILSTDGVFVIMINEFKDNRHKDFELKNYYSQEKKEFIYYYQPYIKRSVKINLSISFFEGITGNLLWNKEYTDEVSSTYLGDDEEVIPLFDKQLFKDFINKPVEEFIIDTSPQEKIYKRIVVMEK
ncbi:MAG: tetratricopeptide repeat protein [bacterium]